jgi:putative intracellular protease/amidase
MASVVMVVSGASVWTMKNATPHPTGFWSEEFVTPHRKFTDAGFTVTVASPGGVTPTVDPLSFNLSYNNNDAGKVAEQKDYMRRLGAALTSPMRVEDIDPNRFDVIFLVGGHGPMQDMAVHQTMGAVLVAMLDTSRKIVAAVCHGPAGFFTASRRSVTDPRASSRRRAPTERGPLRTVRSRASAMKRRRRRASAATRLGFWRTVSVFLAHVISQNRLGRRTPSSTATSSPGSRTTRPVLRPMRC